MNWVPGETTPALPNLTPPRHATANANNNPYFPMSANVPFRYLCNSMPTAVKEYQPSEDVLKKIVSEISHAHLPAFFERKSVITGDEIARFHRHEQTNKFVLLQIFREWNTVSSKFAHPYFDFGHEEVQSAIQTFQNVLSRHILVEKLEFRALFEKAVYNTLRLVLQPETALVGFFFAGKESISVGAYEKYVRYFSDFDFAVSGIAAYHKREALTTMERAVFLEKFRRIIRLYEQKHGRGASAYREELFVELTGKRLADYGFEDAAATAPRTEPPRVADSFAAPRTEPPWVADSFAAPRTEPLRVADSFAAPRTEPPRVADSFAAPRTEPLRVADSFAAPHADAGGIPVSEPVKRIVDGFAKTAPARENSISLDSIPIHKQFQYVQKIFAGSNAKFKETLDAVGKCGTWEEAQTYLQTRILNMPGVVREDRVTEEFVQLIRRRFE